jgi:hypothetical protein
MTYRDPRLLPRRDARGHFLEAPDWLRFGPKRPDIADYFWNGARQRHCSRDGCRQVALRRSRFCRHHDVCWRQKRLNQLRTGKGKPPTPAESIRLFRADLKALWLRSPWWPGATIWLAPRLEAAFTEDCRRASVALSRTAPVIANNLRWSWRRSRLNHDDPGGWQRALIAARKRQTKIGAPPDGYVYQPPGGTPPTDMRIKAVLRRASAFERARTSPVTDRTTKSQARRQRLIAPRTPPNFDWQEFFGRHWRDVFSSIWRTHRLSDEDVDGEVGRLMAIRYRDKLAEAEDDGAYGPAARAWDELLKQLRQGTHPGQTVDLHRQVPPIATPAPSRLVGAPDNDEWLRALINKIL